MAIPFRLSRALLVAFSCAALGACASAPEWAKPGTWGIFGGEGASKPVESSPASESPPPPEGQYPNLADTPAKPTPTSEEERRAVVDSLVSDRDKAQHSAEELRGGSEPSAPPPPPAPPPSPPPPPPASGGEPVSPTPKPQALQNERIPAFQGPGTASWAAEGLNLAAMAPVPILGPTRVLSALSRTGSDAPRRMSLHFADGSAAMDKAGVETLVRMAQAARDEGRRIRVIGHASRLTGPPRVEAVLANYAISHARARAVADALVRAGAPPEALIVEAAGDAFALALADEAARRADVWLE